MDVIVAGQSELIRFSLHLFNLMKLVLKPCALLYVTLACVIGSILVKRLCCVVVVLTFMVESGRTSELGFSRHRQLLAQSLFYQSFVDWRCEICFLFGNLGRLHGR